MVKRKRSLFQALAEEGDGPKNLEQLAATLLVREYLSRPGETAALERLGDGLFMARTNLCSCLWAQAIDESHIESLDDVLATF